MNVQNLVKLWPQYQKWLKQNNITPQNIQQKIPEFVAQVRKNPSEAQRLDSYISNPELAKIAKQTFNFSDEQIAKVREMAHPQSNSSSGNLTPEQLAFIKKFRR